MYVTLQALEEAFCSFRTGYNHHVSLGAFWESGAFCFADARKALGETGPLLTQPVNGLIAEQRCPLQPSLVAEASQVTEL